MLAAMAVAVEVRLNLADVGYMRFLCLRGLQENVTACELATQCGKCFGIVPDSLGASVNVQFL
jgi:hypothetical protein